MIMRLILRRVFKLLKNNSTPELYKMLNCFQGHIQGCLKHQRTIPAKRDQRRRIERWRVTYKERERGKERKVRERERERDKGVREKEREREYDKNCNKGKCHSKTIQLLTSMKC